MKKGEYQVTACCKIYMQAIFDVLPLKVNHPEGPYSTLYGRPIPSTAGIKKLAVPL